MKVCSVDGCGNAHRARGLCSSHYNQQHQPNRHAKVEVPCTYCGALVVKTPSNKRRKPFCDYTCRDLHRIDEPYERKNPKGVAVPLPPDHPVRMLMTEAMKSPLRRAVEAENPAAILDAIRAHTTLTPSGCWLWTRKCKDGYPTVFVGGRYLMVHRLTLEAHLGKPLGKQPAHHKCANTTCVNPAHLQAVTARENVAEMLARRYMESRIHDLEAALRIHDPAHPLLAEVGIDHAA